MEKVEKKKHPGKDLQIDYEKESKNCSDPFYKKNVASEATPNRTDACRLLGHTEESKTAADTEEMICAEMSLRIEIHYLSVVAIYVHI